MKKISKSLAFLLSFILIMTSCIGIVSADAGLTVTTGNGAVLGDTIDLNQKTLNVTFPDAVEESALADGVKVLTDTATEKVLHIERAEAGTADYATLVTYTPTTAFTSGKLKLSFSYQWTGTRYPVIYFYRTSQGSSKSAVLEKILIDDNGWKKLKDSSTLGASTLYDLPTGATSTKGRWVDFELEFDLDRTSPAYDFSIDGNAWGSLLGCNHYTSDGSKDISKIVIGPDDNSGSVADLSIKDFKISHTVSGTTTTYAPNYSKATGETGFDFTYGPSFSNGIATASVEDVLGGTEVTMARTYNSDTNTYTLTNEGEWDVEKDYSLVISKDVTGEAADSVYTFGVRDLGGISSVTTGDGEEIGEEIDLAQKSLNVTFAGDVEESALESGVNVLTDVENKNILHMKDTDVSQYGVLMQRSLSASEAYTTGTVTLNYSYKYTGDRCPQMYIRNSSGEYLVGLRLYTESDANKYWVEITKAGGTLPASCGNVKDTWVDVEAIIDLSASPKTYTLKVNGTVIPGYENATFADASKVTNVGQFLFFADQSAAGDVDIMWKDIKITHKASENATPVVTEPDFSTAGRPAFFAYYPDGTCDVVEDEIEICEEVAVDYATDTTTNTVTVLPKTAFEYLGNYRLTVPTSVMSDGGANLIAGTEINFTAIYADSLYSDAGGFKAGTADITEISSTFTGDITGWAHITNIGTLPKSAELIVALYLDDVLVDFDVVPVTDIQPGATVEDAYGTVTIDADKASEGYKVAVFVWESTDNLVPVSQKYSTN